MTNNEKITIIIMVMVKRKIVDKGLHVKTVWLITQMNKHCSRQRLEPR